MTQGPTSSSNVAYQDIYGFTPGQTYVVSAWVRSSEANAGNVILAIHDTQGNGMVGNGIVAGTSWQQVSQVYTVTSNRAMRIHLVHFEGSQTTYWDDVTVMPLPRNGGFETGSMTSWNLIGTASTGSIAHSGAYGLTMQRLLTTALLTRMLAG